MRQIIKRFKRPNSKNEIVELLRTLDKQEDLLHIIPMLCAAFTKLATGNSWVVDKKVWDVFETHGFHLTANHYYSAIPTISTLPRKLWAGPYMEDAFLNVTQDGGLIGLGEYLQYSPELKDIRKEYSDTAFYWDNGLFPPLDAMAYYGVIRENRPEHIVEIGSGFSSEVALRALEKNKKGSLTCVEPYPSGRLEALMHSSHRLLTAGVEDVPLEVFTTLESGDILFVDTSHTVKVGSEVNYIVFHILPVLKEGVLIHFHDIFLPYEYPEEWITELGLLWNEQHLILAFLMFNRAFGVLVNNYSQSIDHAEELRHQFKDYDIWDLKHNMSGPRGASLWLRRN